MNAPQSSQLAILCGTNRPDAASEIVTAWIRDLATEMGYASTAFSLSELPRDFAFAHWEGRSAALDEMGHACFGLSDRFVFIIPEYNGSYPGVLKAFIDACDTAWFKDKKAGCVGISSGRAGNLRGSDQLTNVLNYLKVNVHYNKPKLSGIDGLIKQGLNRDAETTATLRAFLSGVMSF